MPRLKLEYHMTVDNPVDTFGSKSSYNESKKCVMPFTYSWLSSHSGHSYYNKSNIKETYATKGVIYQQPEIQRFLYDSLKDAISQTELECVCDDDAQSLTIFGVKIYPTTVSVYPYTTWFSSTAYGQQWRVYPMVLKDGDMGVQINSFASHAFDNSSMLSSIIGGGAHSSVAPDYWGQASLAFEQASSMIPWLRQTYPSLADACAAINDVRLTLMVYYNTDYILVNYRGNDTAYELPLFCLIKGTIQNTEKTPVVYCCANPNDVRNYTDHRFPLAALQVHTKQYTPCHSLFTPDCPDMPLVTATEKTRYTTPVEARFCNSIPYFIDWRTPNFQVWNLVTAIPSSAGINAPLIFFRKQNVTGMSGTIQFSDNIIYADENCITGSYYEIDGEQYWCASNSPLEQYISDLGLNAEGYHMYNRRIMLKL